MSDNGFVAWNGVWWCERVEWRVFRWVLKIEKCLLFQLTVAEGHSSRRANVVGDSASSSLTRNESFGGPKNIWPNTPGLC